VKKETLAVSLEVSSSEEAAPACMQTGAEEPAAGEAGTYREDLKVNALLVTVAIRKAQA